MIFNININSPIDYERAFYALFSFAENQAVTLVSVWKPP